MVADHIVVKAVASQKEGHWVFPLALQNLNITIKSDNGNTQTVSNVKQLCALIMWFLTYIYTSPDMM